MPRHFRRFNSEKDKAAWLDAQAHGPDIRDTLIQQTAARFAAMAGPQAAMEALHRYCRDSIIYQKDPDGEQFASPAVVLRRGWDDCDGKARTLVALAVTIGHLRPQWAIQARCVDHWKRGHFVHVSAAVRWFGSELHPFANPAGWVASDPIVRGLELGHNPEEARDPRTGQIPTV